MSEISNTPRRDLLNEMGLEDSIVFENPDKETGELINFKIKDVENKLKILKNDRKKHRRI